MDENRNLDDYRVSEAERHGFPRELVFLLVGVGVGSLLVAMLTPKTGKQTSQRASPPLRRCARHTGSGAIRRSWMQRGSDWANIASSKVAPITRKFKREIL